MPPLNFIIDEKKCTGCGACVRDCPNDVIRHDDGKIGVTAESAAGCIECQHCLAVCPVGALSVFGLKPEDSFALAPEKLPTPAQMKLFLRGRRTVRQYDRNPVDKKIVAELLTDLAYAPTGCNDRALIFSTVSDRATMVKYLEKICGALTVAKRAGRDVPDGLWHWVECWEQNGVDHFFRGAPQLLLISLDAAKEPHTGVADVLIAGAYFELLATAAGLGVTWCGILSMVLNAAPALRPEFGLSPDGYFYALLFGKPLVRYARTVQRDHAARITELKV
ncbi:MAG: nitroreductase family protein [Planctomycetota bacterium]|jgi:Fe-S-cluster-containing hydrogenase component 2|nr:nitroreductase family protein [Planctomycetota bacterium]